MAFQQQNGLPGTGTVDASTWAALDAVRHGVHDANDLYAHFLIDVEMGPCMLTSRIKQATELGAALRPALSDGPRSRRRRRTPSTAVARSGSG